MTKWNSGQLNKKRGKKEADVKKTFVPMPGIEPGPPGWKPGILTTRPHRIAGKKGDKIIYKHKNARFNLINSPSVLWSIFRWMPRHDCTFSKWKSGTRYFVRPFSWKPLYFLLSTIFIWIFNMWCMTVVSRRQLTFGSLWSFLLFACLFQQCFL